MSGGFPFVIVIFTFSENSLISSNFLILQLNMSVLPVNIHPLDISNLSVKWPKWRQAFEIYIEAAYDGDLSGRKKLSLFLHLIGPEGVQMVNQWFPELIDFGSPEARSISFTAVLKKFNESMACQDPPMVWSIDVPPSEAEVEEQPAHPRPEQPLETCPCISKILSYLNMTDIESLRQSSPRMEGLTMAYFDEGNKLTIDAFSALKFNAKRAVYMKYINHVKNLEITGVLNSFLSVILAHFPFVKRLTLRNLAIGMDNVLISYPGVEHFIVINCDMDSRLLCGWIKQMKMLKSLHVENVSGVYTKEEEIIYLDHLNSLTIIYNTNKPRTGFRFYNFKYSMKDISIYMDLAATFVRDFEWDYITHASVKLLVISDLGYGIPVDMLCSYAGKFYSLRRLRIVTKHNVPLHDAYFTQLISQCEKRKVKLELSNKACFVN